MSAHAAFDGPVRCERLAGAAWRLSGRIRADDPGAAPEQAALMLNGAREFELPAQLESPELWHEATSAGGVRWLLRTGRATRAGAATQEREHEQELPLRSVQLHLTAGPALQALFAPPPAPWGLRALAWLLLNLVRIPGAASLLTRMRGAAGGG